MPLQIPPETSHGRRGCRLSVSVDSNVCAGNGQPIAWPCTRPSRAQLACASPGLRTPRPRLRFQT